MLDTPTTPGAVQTALDHVTDAPRPGFYVISKQTFTLEIADDAGRYRVKHVFKPFADSPDTVQALLNYDNERSISYKTEGKDTEIKTAATMAAINLWDRMIESVEGYGNPGEDLPANWKELVPAEDKVATINDLLFVDLKETQTDEDAPIRGRAWGSAAATKTIDIVAYFDGREVFLSHTLKAKTAAEVMAYDRIKSRITLGKNEMSLKPQFKQKADLYDKLIVSVDGYSCDAALVPVHHKAFVITAYFDTDINSTTKKSTS
jgi:hypothetical protein